MKAKNRALRSTAMIIFAWTGIRSTMLLTAPVAVATDGGGGQATSAVGLISPALIAPKTPLAGRVRHGRAPMPGLPNRHVVEFHDKIAGVPAYAVGGVGAHPPPVWVAARHVDTPGNAAGAVGAQAQTLATAPARQPIPAQPKSQLFNPAVSAWAIIRPTGGTPTLATNGQLGASQVGVRVQLPVLRLANGLTAAFNLRVSAPIDQATGREAGIGFAVRRAGVVPVELIVERRVGLDRDGRNAFAIIAASGVDDVAVGAQVMLTGYVQAGAVGLARRDRFIDGAARVERVVFGRNAARARIGAAVWGAAQPGLSRIDLGPTISTTLRIGTARVRLASEYRWRVAGRARPGSGPAASIGADF